MYNETVGAKTEIDCCRVRTEAASVLKPLRLLLTAAVLIPSVTSGMNTPGGGESVPFAFAAAETETSAYLGSATVRVPIVAPPGRPKVTPKVELRYSSRGGLSSVGFGWSLEMGVIMRDSSKGVPVCWNDEMDDYVRR